MASVIFLAGLNSQQWRFDLSTGGRTSGGRSVPREDLEEIYVDPDYWRRGVGTRLLECGIDRLPDGTERLVLETLADNDVARSFYEARGFERIGASEFEIAGAAYPTVVYSRELRVDFRASPW